MLQMFQEFRDRFGPFRRAVRRLETQENKTFDLIFLHGMPDRFGHLWQDPVFVSRLYRVPPERILVVLWSPPCSEFAVQTLSRAGFTLCRASDLDGGKMFVVYIDAFRIPEIDFFGKTVIHGHRRLYDASYQHAFGHAGSLPNLVKPSYFEDRRSDLYAKYGIPADKPIAVVHVRESGWWRAAYHDFRNASISNYIEAINFLIARGFFVVRIGDATMTPADCASPDFLDLARSPSFVDGEDACLIAYCSLYIGQTSGPYSLAAIMGKDAIITNEPGAYIGRWVHDEETDPLMLVLYKTNVSRADGHRFSLLDILFRQVRHTAEEYERDGIDLVENTSEEILLTVQEYLARRSGAWDLTPDRARDEVLNLVWSMRQAAKVGYTGLGHPKAGCFVSHVHWRELEANPALIGLLGDPGPVAGT
jgi:putative glycosyltransferase (TIGR04372 family)